MAITPEQEQVVTELADHYLARRKVLNTFLEGLHVHISEAESLAPLIHSVKRRLKDPDHLRDKLIRKIEKAEKNGEVFRITKDNLFTEITDLAGYRILHMHTRQMQQINEALLAVLDEAQWSIFQEPFANVWDEESKTYFEGIGIGTEVNPRLYSSVHYVIQPKSKAKITIEIQVRTLSEEIWGEVDHKFNYPHPIDSVSCGEQIKVLARVASSCTRLVDSIFASYADYLKAKGENPDAATQIEPPLALPSAVAASETIPDQDDRSNQHVTEPSATRAENQLPVTPGSASVG
jgi:putative GTP pyrophosphokinase